MSVLNSLYLFTPRSLWHRATAISRFGSLLALTVFTSIALAGLGMITGVLSARLLGPDGRGELAAIQTWPMFLSSFAVLGLSDAIAYYSAKEPERDGQYVITGMMVALPSSLIFAVAGYCFMPYLLAAQSPVIVQAARTYLWLLPINVLFGMPPFALRGKNDLVFWNFCRALPVFSWVGVILYCLMRNISSAEVLARLYLIVSSLISGAVTIFIVWRRLHGPFVPLMRMVRPMISYGLPTVLSSIPAILNLRLDQMLIAAFVGPQILGLYVVAVAWSTAGTMLSGAVSTTVLPRVAGATDSTQQAQLLAQFTRLGFSLNMLVACVTAVTAPIAIPIFFGEKFLASIPATLVLSVAAGVSAFNGLLTASALSLGKPRFVLWSESIGLIATALLLWLLLTRYQLMGAAWASLLSYLVTGAVLMKLLMDQTGLKLTDLLIPTRQDRDLLIEKLRAVRSTGNLV